MRLAKATCAPTAADADGVFLDTQITATGAQTLNGVGVSGGVVTLGAAQLVTFTSGAGDNVSGVTFTVTGTDADGNVVSEAIVGPNATTVTGAVYFKTITEVSASATTGVGVTVSCGWAITAVSNMVRGNLHRTPFNIGFGCVISGTSATYTVQHTFDDIKPLGTSKQSDCTWFDHETIAGKNTSEDGSYTYAVTGMRIRVTASTSGTVTGTFVQAGL